jgi:hypothetical protein
MILTILTIPILPLILPAPSTASAASAAPAGPEANATQGSGGALQLLRVTPSGDDVPPGRQIVLEFNRPVVPLGRMERTSSEVPVTIDPPADCQWRWLNPSALACQLGEKSALAPSTRYSVTVQPGIKTESGAALAGAVTHTFITERPKVARVWFVTWLSPTMPQIGVRFNQPVQEASVAGHVYFQTSSGSRVAASVKEDPESLQSESAPRGLAWLVSPPQELKPNDSISVRVEPGVLSTQGKEAGVENRVVLSFQTFPKFAFLGVECLDMGGKKVLIRPGDALESKPRCSPEREVSLVFSSPVMKDELQPALKVSPELAAADEELDPWEEVYTGSRLTDSRSKGETYSVSLPQGPVKPFKTYSLHVKPATIKDEFGRALADPINVKFATDHLAPDYTLPKPEGVLEKGLDTEVPLIVTNVGQMKIDYRAHTTAGKSPSQSKVLKVPKEADATFTLPLGVRKLIAKSSGVVQGHVSATPPIRGKEASEGWFFAQVTPFGVHAKVGHHNTLVWVTDLRTGEPAPGVEVEIRKDSYKEYDVRPEVLARGETDPDGLASLQGTAAVDPDLELLWAYEADKPSLFIFCRKGEDMAVMPLSYDFKAASEGANREYIPDYLRPLHGHIRAWGATAQGIYKVGDTVQYKIYVRDQGNLRFVQPPSGAYQLKVTDPMDKVVYEREGIQLNSFGAMDGEFTVPKNGAVGGYQFSLSADFTTETWQPMRVLVSDFTPSPFKVTVDLNGQLFSVGDTVKASTQAKLHAGGPYAKAGVRVTATLEARPFVSKNPVASGFEFGVLDETEYETPESQTIFQTQGTLDDNGNLETELTIPDNPVLYGRMTVESAVRDDRGKMVANRATATYAGLDRYVGLLQKDWVLQQSKPSTVRVLVVDREGNPVSGSSVHVKVEHEEVRAARVKGAGDAYLTHYEEEWVTESETDLTSDLEPQEFEFTPKHAGGYRITATIGQGEEGEKGAKARIERWVVGKGRVLFKSVEGNLLDVVPEKEEYRVGDTARFLVKNPLPGARALITVERFGVIEKWVKVLEGSTEIVEIPVLPDYLPGFYLSVLVTSPRVEKPVTSESGSDAEDLGKPAFRMGYAQVNVKDPYKEIEVGGKPEKEVYKPRDTVTMDLHAASRNLAPGEKPVPIELAVTVLDEAVFDLLKQGKSAFDPYEGFYSLDPLDLSNYNLIMQLIGRQKFGKKGASAGGGGGPDLGMRSVFKFVSYWNPSLPVDENGNARITFQVPDNLTGWRVLAMATSPEDRMGLGTGVFRVSQSTELRPVLPNQVTEGDRFEAGFTVMNRTQAARTLDVTLEADGPIRKEEGKAFATMTQQVVAEPYQRYTVRLPLETTGLGEIVLKARAGDAEDRDAVQYRLPVLKRQSLETAAVYGSTEAGEATEPILFPADMRPDTGEVRVGASPTVIGGVTGAFEYMRDYPYGCWEQKLSKGVMAAYFKVLRPYLDKSFSWDESVGLADRTLVLAAEFQAPNGGMAYYVPKDELTDPYLTSFTALAFSWLKSLGHEVPANVEGKLVEYLDKVLRHDMRSDLYTGGMGATVRAVALAALAERGKITLADLERFEAHLPEMSLFGKALFLQSALKVADTLPMRQKVLKDILAHSDQSSGKIVFSETLDSRYQSILSSSPRTNSAILSALLAYQAASPGDASLADIGDIPVRLMRTITLSRKGRDHWASTQENLFAMKALHDYGRAYEKAEPDMSVQVRLDETSLGEARFTKFTDPPVEMARPVGPGDVGRKASVKLRKTGEGRLYYDVKLSYSPAEMKADPVNAGIEIHREYSTERDGAWVLLDSPMDLKTGDLVRVDLYVSVPAERYFVVVEDPVPGALEPVNRDLATASQVDSAKGELRYPDGSFRHRFNDWLDYGYSRWSFYHKELRHSAAIFYSELLPAGRYLLSYVAQAIAPGEFVALATKAEEMYNPEVFGKGAPATLRVEATE